jgi:DNA-binding HxlR family transcriptional regulator
MRRTRFDEMDCSIAQALDIVGEWWTLLVLRDAFQGVRRFEDFQRNLGIARNVLTDRLRTLVHEGILERRQYQEHPERYEYRLTEKGLDLYPVIVGLMQWGDKWAPGSRRPRVVLTHKACEHDVAPVLSCPHCNDALDARAMRFRVNRRAGSSPPAPRRRPSRRSP